MTSNGGPVLNHPPPPASSPSPRSQASPSSSRPRRETPHEAHNGNHHGSDDAAGESEAETVVLGDARDAVPKETRAIKTEQRDDDGDDDTKQLHAIKEASRGANGRKNSGADTKDPSIVNGAKHGSEHDAKSPIPTSPSSRTTSRHTKETSPTDSAKSPVQSTTSPPQPSGRGRSASTFESRKRKLRDEPGAKSLEPPRQKAKTEGLKDSRTQPTSPATPGLGRLHKRSQSTQSVVQSAAGRKRREPTALALPERRHWSTDSSSENSSSPRPAQTPSQLAHSRTKRSSHRALTSPARTMTHKRNVDKFGATRLARESEKGDLQAVRAAYNAAPEELDQEDFAGIAPLQKAALNGRGDVVEFLLKKGCRTDCESNDRDTPLIDAVENGHLDVVRLLLDQGHVNPHHQNKKGQRAIDVLDPDVTDAEEIEKVLKEAMRRHADTTMDEEVSHPGLTKQKSASRLLYNEYNTETLVEKAGDGDIAAVGELINSNIKPNIACGVAASRGGHYDILSILLASGLKADPDPSKHSETPMLVAIGRGHLKIVKLLLEQDNFNPTRRNRDGKTYWELSEERQGPKWEQEREMLKSACEDYQRTHKSPKRAKKEAPNPSAVRTKRKSSPTRRERSSSPRQESKRNPITKSSTIPQVQQKSRRLMSGKEMANRDVKRRRRVVSEESSDDESDNKARPPKKKTMSKPRSYSEGEEPKPVKKHIKQRAEGHDMSKKRPQAGSDESDHERQPNRQPKIRTRTEKVHRVKPTPTPDAESPDERKPVNKLIKSRMMEGKIKKRRPSEVSVDDSNVKKTPTVSATSTPAPPEKASTPEIVRERRQEAERQAAELKRKNAEAEARQREEEEAARKAAEEEELRKKAEAEAEAKRLAEEAEAAAEAARKREEEEKEAKRLAAEEEARQEARRQEELAARQNRLSKLPRALRRACELGNNRPLHFSGEELGISAVFLPLYYATSNDLSGSADQPPPSPCKTYIMSFQAVGILGLPELDLALLSPPYSSWDRIPVSRKHRELLLRQYDVALLAQDYRFPMEGTSDFDYAVIQERIREARQQFLDMEGLYWIEDRLLCEEVETRDSLGPLVNEIKDVGRRRRIHGFGGEDAGADAPREKKTRPRKSFMDVVLGREADAGGDAPTPEPAATTTTPAAGDAVQVNGDG